MQTLRAIAVGLWCVLAWPVQAVDIQALTQETQRMEQQADKLTLIWWIPTEYWQASFNNVRDMSDQQKAEFLKIVDQYFVVAIIDATLDKMGTTIVPKPKQDIARHLTLSLNNGPSRRPLPDAQVSADAKSLFAMMKPILGNMLGQFGQGIEFMLFNPNVSEGDRIDLKKPGRVSVTLNKTPYHWRLPLGSLLPPKHDAATGESFPGNYEFNPFTGTKLSTPKP